MTPEKLAELMDLYGSAVDRWPDRRYQAAARALLAESEPARRVQRQAQRLETCFGPHDDSAIDAAATERLIALTLQRAQQTPQLPPPLTVRLRAGLERLAGRLGEGWLCYGLPATVALALGILVGHATLDRSVYSSRPPSVESLITATHTSGPFEL